MTALLALRNLVLRPWRSLFLLLGYGLGVAVMIVLLAIGEALLVQARDEKLVGGGSITVLPEGIDVEVMKTGGLGGLFFSIDHARFIYRQLLAAPRLASSVAEVAPQIDGKLLYLRTSSGREMPVLASGEIPSRTAALGALPPMIREGAHGTTTRSIACGGTPRPPSFGTRSTTFTCRPLRCAAIRRGRSGTTSTSCPPIDRDGRLSR